MSAVVDLHDLPLHLHPHAQIGIELFNAGEYFEAHEALESAWMVESGPIRDLYRGILQVAVAYYHLLRGNYRGALKMLDRCKPWMAPFPSRCLGINVERLRQDVLRVEAEISRLGPDRLADFDHSLLRPVIVDP